MTMRCVRDGLVVAGGIFLLVCSGLAQEPGTGAPAGNGSKEGRTTACSPATTGSVQTYFLNNATEERSASEIVVSLRTMLPPETRIYLAPTSNAFTVCASPGEQVLAAKLIHDLDRPRKSYRLTYTLTETDGGRRVGTQHYTMMVSAGQRSQMKVGSKVPVATGSYSGSAMAAVQTQFQYVDVGMNFDATLIETAAGGMLKTKVEQSSADESKTISGVTEPLLRQTTFEGSPMLVLGKPVVLGTVDVPGSTRHEEVEVMAEEVR